ncbi:Cilia- and flagella-associated protein 65 [Saguinus oedipus]|uniref:Cilia- and flagella-associated protein 65 n=1 Tax=Saguinus oedipus TaxID=9490 RepID=A0ABQ9VGF5_SAGOE|nr:Cilia- and flagella-associated protein 65 [Saguinus oedipus]
MDNQMHSPKKQERVKKRVIWGIEVAEELHWKGWELGKETTRSLVLKNRSLKLQKIKYSLGSPTSVLRDSLNLGSPSLSLSPSGLQPCQRPPKTKFFFTVIPQPIFLSPGITLTLPIVFRPLEEKEYVDQLWFEKAEGIFCVGLRATLPCHRLICPPSLQLPMCAVGDTTEACFCLDNVGDLPTFFTWEFSSPFQMLPTMGLLEPGQASQIKVTFQPLIALIHEVQATCWYGEGSQQRTSIQLQAVAKCAQLLVSIRHKRLEDQDAEGFQKLLHFGSVAVGCTLERQIRLHNPSAVGTGREGQQQDSWPPGPEFPKITPLHNAPVSLYTFGPKSHVTHVNCPQGCPFPPLGAGVHLSSPELLQEQL